MLPMFPWPPGPLGPHDVGVLGALELLGKGPCPWPGPCPGPCPGLANLCRKSRLGGPRGPALPAFCGRAGMYWMVLGALAFTCTLAPLKGLGPPGPEGAPGRPIIRGGMPPGPIGMPPGIPPGIPPGMPPCIPPGMPPCIPPGMPPGTLGNGDGPRGLGDPGLLPMFGPRPGPMGLKELGMSMGPMPPMPPSGMPKSFMPIMCMGPVGELKGSMEPPGPPGPPIGPGEPDTLLESCWLICASEEMGSNMPPLEFCELELAVGAELLFGLSGMLGDPSLPGEDTSIRPPDDLPGGVCCEKGEGDEAGPPCGPPMNLGGPMPSTLGLGQGPLLLGVSADDTGVRDPDPGKRPCCLSGAPPGPPPGV